MKYTEQENELIFAALKVMESKIKADSDLINRVEQMKRYARLRIGNLEREVFLVCFLDSQNRVIKAEIMFQGTISQSHIHIREIIKRALELNAGAISVAHNHPSGSALPSGADKDVTKKIIEACNLMEIRFLDHVIVSETEEYSMADAGDFFL